MKKALSVLLVAAALFGFYGSAVTVNDLLACKDYWEEAGEKSTADMNKLEDGLNQLKDNEQAYLDGQDQLAEGEATLAQGEADYAAAPGKLAAARAAIANGEKELAKGKNTLAGAKDLLKQLKAGVKELQDEEKGYPAWKNGFDTALKVAPDTVEALSTDGSLDGDKVQAKLKETKETKESLDTAVSALDGLDQVIAGIEDAVPEAARDAEAYAMPAPDALKYIAGQLGASAYTTGNKTANQWISICKTLQGMVIKNVAEGAGDTEMKKINSAAAVKGLQSQAAEGIKSLEGLQQLVDGKKTIQDKLLPLLEKDAVKSNDVIKKQLGDVNQIIKGLKGDDKTFEATMDQIMKKAPALVAAVSKAVNKGQKDLNAGQKKLASGKAQYRQGLADYAAAPGKLEDGRQQLADGKAQLAQYEDGEQQIRDGLATLFNTEADLELESIANRLNGDGDFDNGDNHLEIDEGLNAVEVGRGYQAEDGVLITNEIMGRAVATGGLIGAAVLAVLAAILSFLKKNKGAAVFALLAAVAGAFGAFYGPAQGTYFSDIAGSTVGTTTWVAAGVLGAVALVHAIAHFAAPKNA